MPVEVDILDIFRLSPELLNILLKDHTTSKEDIQRNIFWATSDYEYLGEGYREKWQRCSLRHGYAMRRTT